MVYKVLYFFIEGPDDERFFKSVIQPLVEGQFNFVKYISYAGAQKTNIQNLIRALDYQPNNKYLFICDMDARGDDTYCITKRKDKEYTAFGSNMDKNRIFVVKEEIESWYYAGIPDDDLQKMKMPSITNTERLTKEDFEKLVPKDFTSKKDFMIELLKNYSIETARQQNPSFRYLLNKLDIITKGI